MEGRLYLVYLSEYQDPADLVGPFETREAALAHYRQALVDAGADLADEVNAETLYLTDDIVRLAKLA